MRPCWAIIDRDLRKYLRSPAQIAVSLFLPLLQLVIIGYAFGGKVKDVPVALIDLDRGAEALRLRDKLGAVDANAKTFEITRESSPDSGVKAAKEGEVAAAILIPEDYSRKVNQRNRPRIGLILDNTDPFVVDVLKQKMSELVADVNEPQVKTRYPGLVSVDVVEIFPYIEYMQYLLPGSITLAIFVCSLIGGGLLYIDDKARGFHEGYLATPISKFQLVVGMLACGTIRATIAGLIVTIVGSWIAGIAHLLTLSTLLLLLSFTVLVAFSLISMIGLMMVRVNDPVVPRATLGLLNTLLFFPSGAMYPIYSFPSWLKMIAKVDPFTYAVHGFRAILLKNVGIEAIMTDAIFLGIFSLTCFIGVLILFRRRL